MESLSTLDVAFAILRESNRGSDLYHLKNKFSPFLTPSQINNYLLEMTKHGLIRPTARGFKFAVTSKGSQFLTLYDELLTDVPGNETKQSSIALILSAVLRFASILLNRFGR